MDVKSIKESIVTNVYHITLEGKVPLHDHEAQDETFYCIKGSGYGVTVDKEIKLEVGDVFIAPAKTLHSVRTDEEMYLVATLIPVV